MSCRFFFLSSSSSLFQFHLSKKVKTKERRGNEARTKFKEKVTSYKELLRGYPSEGERRRRRERERERTPEAISFARVMAEALGLLLKQLELSSGSKRPKLLESQSEIELCWVQSVDLEFKPHEGGLPTAVAEKYEVFPQKPPRSSFLTRSS